jgi:DNA-binding NtrC family response regulator
MASILIVDDRAYVREILSEELAFEGYHIASVDDAESMWGHLRHSQPDLVILDLCLQGLTG